MVQPKTIAIVVTYNPERERLKQALAALAPQVAKILIVDNGSTEPISGLRHAVSETEIEVIPLGDNRGIATAQNVGIERARAEGADYVALFDQDSIAPADLIAVLMSFAEAKRAQGEAIAAIGPNFRDLRLNKEARLLRTIGRHTKTQSRADGAVVPVDHLIASGSLIPMEALDQVGLMRDELFIDYVDIEWCMRAEHRFGRISYAHVRRSARARIGQPSGALFRHELCDSLPHAALLSFPQFDLDVDPQLDPPRLEAGARARADQAPGFLRRFRTPRAATMAHDPPRSVGWHDRSNGQVRRALGV